MEELDAFKVSSDNTIRDRFLKTKILTFSPPDIATNNQASVSSIKVSYGAKDEDTNVISKQIVAPIKVQ